MVKHFVTFYSPGTFTSEQVTKEISSWDINVATEMANDVLGRHGARRPYGFQFSTRSRKEDELDSKVTNKSKFYFLGGKIETIDEVRNRQNPEERILLQNMECNSWGKIIVNTNSWKITLPFDDKKDILL